MKHATFIEGIHNYICISSWFPVKHNAVVIILIFITFASGFVKK